MNDGPVRVLVLWSPDWPVTAAARAAHVSPHRPAAVVVGNRVLACSAVARARGVRRGLRRREAQARCPELAVLTRDPDRDARAFEPVVVAIEELAPGVEVVRPGLVALAAQGPAGYFGGEQAAAERLVDQVAARAGVECQVGIADGLFAAVLAARRGVAVGVGDTPRFLAPLGVEELDREPELDRSELVDLLRRLGLRSLGAFGTLDAEDVASRFGADAVLAHRLARGLDPRPPVRRRPPEELAVEIELDPPVDRVDAAAFAARTLAERLHRALAGYGLSCTRLGVAARTEAGEEPYRIWRCAEPLTPAGTVDRVRWQLDAWLTRGGAGAVSRLRLVPEETVTAGALQLGLWGDVGEADERAGRALVRVQALLGPESVATAVLVGGRDPAERVRLVPWGDDREEGVPVEAFMITDSAPGAVSGAAQGSRAAIMVTRVGADTPAARSAVRVITGAEPVAVSDAVPGSRAAIMAAGGGDGGPSPAALDTPTGTGPGSTPPGTGPGSAPGAAPAGPRVAPSERPFRATDARESAVRSATAPAGWPPDVARAAGRPVLRPATGKPVIAVSEPGTALDTSGGSEPPITQPGAAPTGAAPTGTPTRRPSRPTVREPPPPWPGRLPGPSPATVLPDPPPVELVDAAGRPVHLEALDLLATAPHRISVGGGPWHDVVGWAGPWPVRQRWWSPDGVDGGRLQVALDDGVALLLLARAGGWWMTGVYD